LRSASKSGLGLKIRHAGAEWYAELGREKLDRS